MTRYKTVALDSMLVAGKKQSANEVIAPVAQIIQREAAGGWKFVNMYDMPIMVKPGCLGKLLGNAGDVVYYYMMVFSQEA